MCVYSNTLDYGRRTWDVPQIYPSIMPTPAVYPPPQPKPMPTDKQWRAFLKLLEAAEAFDEEAGQPDCEDPEKAAWKQRIQDKLDALQDELDNEPGATDPATNDWDFTEGISNSIPSTVTVAPYVGGMVTSQNINNDVLGDLGISNNTLVGVGII